MPIRPLRFNEKMRKAKAKVKEKETSKERRVSKAKTKEKAKEAKRVNHMVENPHHGDLGNQRVIHGQEKDTHFMIIQANNQQKEVGAVNHQITIIG